MEKRLKIAFLDVVGLKYDDNTIEERGLGGSESAIIYMARELNKLNFNVTVFNRAENEGDFNGITYKAVEKAEYNTEEFDVLVVSRSCLPFTPVSLREQVLGEFGYDMEWAKALVDRSKYKVLWLHDTFCQGDEYLEKFVLDGYIDKVFTLSDWHSNYVMNGHEWRGRYFEVLKPYIWQTRNGIRRYFEEVDIDNKDKNLFVYNASVTKGMVSLLEQVWPRVKEEIPDGKLMVIGGYYPGVLNDRPDGYEFKWQELYDKFNGQNGIEFTGVISQKEIAEILCKASLTIYPALFPETFGISTLESLNYNTPVVTNRFGALEQVALERCSYLLDYPIDFNSDQVSNFVKIFTNAYNDDYLRQQKMYACNEVKSINTWDTVALQWKEFFFNVLDLYMPLDELKQVKRVNRDVQRIFNKRFINREDIQEFSREETNFLVISPVYNAEQYIEKTIRSVANQLYDNYRMIIVDDLSTDDTLNVAEKTIDSLPMEIRDRFIVKSNMEKKYAVTNQVDIIDRYGCEDDVVILLDGDDWLVNDNYVFTYLDNIYSENEERDLMTYGSCYSLADQIELVSQPYPKKIHETKDYRAHNFTWGMPYTHLRTFRVGVFNKIDRKLLKDENGDNWRAGGDNALFYGLLENADGIKCVQRILMVYNDINPLNDYKVNVEEQQITREKIVGSRAKKRILIGIPTNKYIESETFKSIYNLDVPEDVELSFECFYGYNVDQVRNLMAEYTIKNGFDYIFFVDSDIVLPRDSLVKLYNWDREIVSGVYRQRFADRVIPEFYMADKQGSRHATVEEATSGQLLEVSSCGFGCVLVKQEVLTSVGYPQFKYHSTLDFKDTISEDTDFCMKARARGYMVNVDTSVSCGHIGNFELII